MQKEVLAFLLVRYPIIGILPAALKVVVAIPQVFCGLGFLIRSTCATKYENAIADGWFLLGSSAVSLGYGLVNIASLGLLGCCVESCVQEVQRDK